MSEETETITIETYEEGTGKVIKVETITVPKIPDYKEMWKKAEKVEEKLEILAKFLGLED